MADERVDKLNADPNADPQTLAAARQNLEILNKQLDAWDEEHSSEGTKLAPEGTKLSESPTGSDKNGNPVDADGRLVLSEVASVSDITDEDFTEPKRSVRLPAVSKTVADVIGTGGKPIVIKRNIFERNARQHQDVTPEQSREILSAALYSPDLYGQNQKADKPYNWVLINTKGEDGVNRLVLLEVNQTKENVEIVHWHFVDERGIEKIKRQAAREGGRLLMLPSAGAEEAGALSGRPSGESSSGSRTAPTGTSQAQPGEDVNRKTREIPKGDGRARFAEGDRGRVSMKSPDRSESFDARVAFVDLGKIVYDRSPGFRKGLQNRGDEAGRDETEKKIGNAPDADTLTNAGTMIDEGTPVLSSDLQTVAGARRCSTSFRPVRTGSWTMRRTATSCSRS